MADKVTRDTRRIRPLAGRTVEFVNDFHGSATAVCVRDDGTISERTRRRVCRDLCGISTCQCGGIRGGRYRIVPCTKDSWLVTRD